MSLNFRPLYKDTDSLYKDKDCTPCSCYCKNDVLLMKQHLNQIYGTQVEGDKHMEFDLQTFYDQLKETCEVICKQRISPFYDCVILKDSKSTIIHVILNVMRGGRVESINIIW